MMRGARIVLALGSIGTACADGSGDQRSDSAVGVAAAASTAAAVTYHSGELEILNVVAPAPAGSADSTRPIAVYFFVMNNGQLADTLDGVEVTGATATLHQQTGTGAGLETMMQLTSAPLPAGEMLRFVPGGRHVMIEGLARPLAVGDVIPLTMIFRHAGRAAVGARVISYGDLESVLSTGDEHAGH